jgi:hypothetical protein
LPVRNGLITWRPADSKKSRIFYYVCQYYELEPIRYEHRQLHSAIFRAAGTTGLVLSGVEARWQKAMSLPRLKWTINFEICERLVNCGLDFRHPELVYTPPRNYPTKLQEQGAEIEPVGSSSIRINNQFTATFLMLLCRKTKGGNWRWNIELASREKPDVTVAVPPRAR